MFVLLHPILREKSSYMVGVVQLVRAPDCGSGGRGFEPHLPPEEGNGVKEIWLRFFGSPHPSLQGPGATLRRIFTVSSPTVVGVGTELIRTSVGLDTELMLSINLLQTTKNLTQKMTKNGFVTGVL